MPVNEDVANTAVLSDTGLRPLPPFLPPLTQALFFIGLLSCSRASRVVLFIPIVCISHYVLFYTTKGKDISDMETANSIALTLLKASDALLINDVAKLRLVGQKNDTNELGLVERVKWALKFFYSPRQIGWTHEPRHVIPPHPTESRWKFVRSRIVHCLGYFFLTDILNTYMCYTPAFWRNDISIADGGIGKRVLHSVMMVSLSWAFFNLVYTIMAVVVVAVRLTDASEWPALYGKISDGYTVRRFWGRVWHQSLRRVFTVHGEFVAFRLLGLRKDSFLGNTVNHYVVFALSGLLHAITEYGLFRGKYWELSTAMSFFFLQATIIMVEYQIGKMLGIRKVGKWMRLAGCCWTVCWFALTFPRWVDPQIRYGFHVRYVFWERGDSVGSLVNYLWMGEWAIRVPPGAL